ncbi:MAG: heterodisulfide reductase, partial [Sulfuricella sp.]|nr:heterodisulfide reductase [Sulfuricella sp.]
FKDGFAQGIKNAMAMQSVGLGMVKAKRLNPMELFGGHGVQDKAGFHAMLKKAREIEDRRKNFA